MKSQQNRIKSVTRPEGRQIEVMNSFELDVVLVNGEMIVDREYYNMKEEQFKQVCRHWN